MHNDKYDQIAYAILGLMAIFILSGFVYAQRITSSHREPIVAQFSRHQAAGPDKVLNISTDKVAYQINEPVLIRITNSTTKPMMQSASTSVFLKSNRYLGRNIGVAMIEKQEDEDWVVVESLWRCPGDCNSECTDIPPIRSNENKEFIWDQQLTSCSFEDGTMEKMKAVPGVYRVSIWLEKVEEKNIIDYSNEFTILGSTSSEPATSTIPELPLPVNPESAPMLDAEQI